MPYFPVAGRPQEEKGGKAPVFPVFTAADRDKICRADSGCTKSRGFAFCENPRLFCRQTEGMPGDTVRPRRNDGAETAYVRRFSLPFVSVGRGTRDRAAGMFYAAFFTAMRQKRGHDRLRPMFCRQNRCACPRGSRQPPMAGKSSAKCHTAFAFSLDFLGKVCYK